MSNAPVSLSTMMRRPLETLPSATPPACGGYFIDHETSLIFRPEEAPEGTAMGKLDRAAETFRDLIEGDLKRIRTIEDRVDDIDNTTSDNYAETLNLGRWGRVHIAAFVIVITMLVLQAYSLARIKHQVDALVDRLPAPVEIEAAPPEPGASPEK